MQVQKSKKIGTIGKFAAAAVLVGTISCGNKEDNIYYPVIPASTANVAGSTSSTGGIQNRAGTGGDVSAGGAAGAAISEGGAVDHGGSAGESATGGSSQAGETSTGGNSAGQGNTSGGNGGASAGSAGETSTGGISASGGNGGSVVGGNSGVGGLDQTGGTTSGGEGGAVACEEVRNGNIYDFYPVSEPISVLGYVVSYTGTVEGDAQFEVADCAGVLTTLTIASGATETYNDSSNRKTVSLQVHSFSDSLARVTVTVNDS